MLCKAAQCRICLLQQLQRQGHHYLWSNHRHGGRPTTPARERRRSYFSIAAVLPYCLLFSRFGKNFGRGSTNDLRNCKALSICKSPSSLPPPPCVASPSLQELRLVS